MSRSSTLLVLLAVSACSRQAERAAAAPAADTTTPVAVAKMPSFDAARTLADIKMLSSDKSKAARRGHNGEELTVKYLGKQFTRIGFCRPEMSPRALQ
jgi:hypothetical protein